MITDAKNRKRSATDKPGHINNERSVESSASVSNTKNLAAASLNLSGGSTGSTKRRTPVKTKRRPKPDKPPSQKWIKTPFGPARSTPGVPRSENDPEVDKLLLVDHSKMFTNKTSVDITIEISGKIFHAHYYVLRVRSPAFFATSVKKRHGKNNSNTKKPIKIEIDEKSGITKKAVEYLLEYFYAGSVNFGNLDPTEIVHLMLAAKIYNEFTLLKMCQRFLLHIFNCRNWFVVLKLAESLSIEEAKYICKLWAIQNLESIVLERAEVIDIGIELFHEVVSFVILNKKGEPPPTTAALQEESQAALRSHFKMIYEEMESSDTLFRFNNELLQCHMAVFLGQSQHLSKLFKKGGEELVLPKKYSWIDSNIFKELLRFFYYREKPFMDNELALNFHHFANDFKLESLSKICDDHLTNGRKQPQDSPSSTSLNVTTARSSEEESESDGDLEERKQNGNSPNRKRSQSSCSSQSPPRRKGQGRSSAWTATDSAEKKRKKYTRTKSTQEPPFLKRVLPADLENKNVNKPQLRRVKSSSSHQGCLWRWNATTEQLHSIYGHEGIVLSVKIMGDKIITGSHDKTLKIWDSKTGKCENTLRGHGGPIWSIDVDETAQQVVSGSGDYTAKLWHVDSGECRATFSGHTKPVSCVRIFGNSVITGSHDNTIRIWNIQTVGHRLLVGHSGVVMCLVAMPGMLLSGSGDSTLRIWDLKSGTCLHTLSAHSDSISSVEMFNCGEERRILTGSRDGTAKLWSLGT